MSQQRNRRPGLVAKGPKDTPVTCTAFAVLVIEGEGGRKYSPVKLDLVDGVVRKAEALGLAAQEYRAFATQHAVTAMERHDSEVMAGAANV